MGRTKPRVHRPRNRVARSGAPVDPRNSFAARGERLVEAAELRAAHGSLIFVTVPIVAAALERWRRVTERRAAAPAAGATGLPDPWLVLLLALWAVVTGLLIGPAPLA